MYHPPGSRPPRPLDPPITASLLSPSTCSLFSEDFPPNARRYCIHFPLFASAHIRQLSFYTLSFSFRYIELIKLALKTTSTTGSSLLAVKLSPLDIRHVARGARRRLLQPTKTRSSLATTIISLWCALVGTPWSLYETHQSCFREKKKAHQDGPSSPEGKHRSKKKPRTGHQTGSVTH